MALIGSYLRRALAPDQLYLGEIDLLCRVRPVPEALVQDLADSVGDGEVPTPLQVFCAPESAEVLRQVPGVTVGPCSRLADAVERTWPEMQRERALRN